MSKILGGYMALAVVVAGTGCDFRVGSGVVSTTTREVGAFSAILIEFPLDAMITVGSQQALELSGEDNLLSLIRTEVHDDTLQVRPAPFSHIGNREPMTLKIFAPTLNAIFAGSASTVTAVDVQTSGMAIMAKEASEVTITNLTTDTVDIHVESSSEVTLTGSASSMDMNLSGVSLLTATEFPVETATVEISGASEGNLLVTNSVSGSVSQNGSALTVFGNPANRDVTVKGPATVDFR